MSKLKVLVVEDDKDIAKLLKYNLEKEGHQAFLAQDGEEGVALFRRERPRLVLLDLMLPKVDGLEVCRLIRAEDKKVPVLMLTAKSTEVDKIVGLEMGADDYVTKPFSVREVMTRVKTLLRRTTGGDDTPASSVLATGALELDPSQYEVRLHKKAVEVTGKEFELLKILWGARGKVLSREEILERVWGFDKAADIDTRTVDQHMARLRAKLGSEKKRLKTIKGVGYKFITE
jgi:two-component system, OmpR family, alkaline phosphatase synthesis response regulator PhoP